MDLDVNSIVDFLLTSVIEYGPRLVSAILVWILGSWIVKALGRGFRALLDKREFDESLKPFLRSLVDVVLKVLLVITILSMLGIEMTSFIALLGAAGLAIGMALSGTLQNFAGGVVILVFRPYKVGDYIDAQGFAGTVKAIQIFNTVLLTPDNVTIIIPNGGLSTGSITNYSAQDTRRVDWVFGIGYGDDADKAKTVLRKLCDDDSRILNEPETFIALKELADSSVNFVVRAWVKSEDYWAVHFEMNEKVYKTFEKEGLNIPFPQMDVHLQKEN